MKGLIQMNINIKKIYFKRKKDVKNLLKILMEVQTKQGFISLENYYDICNYNANFKDCVCFDKNEYVPDNLSGFDKILLTHLDEAKIKHVFKPKRGFYIRFPKVYVMKEDFRNGKQCQ